MPHIRETMHRTSPFCSRRTRRDGSILANVIHGNLIDSHGKEAKGCRFPRRMRGSCTHQSTPNNSIGFHVQMLHPDRQSWITQLLSFLCPIPRPADQFCSHAPGSPFDAMDCGATGERIRKNCMAWKSCGNAVCLDLCSTSAIPPTAKLCACLSLFQANQQLVASQSLSRQSLRLCHELCHLHGFEVTKCAFLVNFSTQVTLFAKYESKKIKTTSKAAELKVITSASIRSLQDFHNSSRACHQCPSDFVSTASDKKM